MRFRFARIRQLPRPLVVLLLATIGILVGVGILLFKYDDTRYSEIFVKSPEFAVWSLLILTLTTLFSVLSLPLFERLKRLKSYIQPRLSHLALAAIFMAFLVYFPLIGWQRLWSPLLPDRSSRILVYYSQRIVVFLTLGYLSTVLPACFGIWGVQLGVEDAIRPTIDTDDIQDYLSFHNDLQFFLTVLGVVLGLSTLATGAIRRAFLAAGATSNEQYPTTIVLAYGAYYTFVVLIVYVPAYISLINAGEQIKNTLLQLPMPDSEQWDEIYERRKKLDTLLNLRVTAQQSVQNSIAVFAPLLGGMITTFLN